MTGEFDLVDVEFDDVDMLSNGFDDLQKSEGGTATWKRMA